MMTERRRLELERDSMHEELQKLEKKKIHAREKLANIKDVNEANALLEELIGIPCVVLNTTPYLSPFIFVFDILQCHINTSVDALGWYFIVDLVVDWFIVDMLLMLMSCLLIDLWLLIMLSCGKNTRGNGVSHNNNKLTPNFYKLQEEKENENVGTNGDVGEAIYGKLVLAESYSSDIIWMLSNVDEGDYLKKAAKKVDQVLELQNAHTSLKHKFNTAEDKYLDDVLNLEAKLKKNENVVIKMSNSVQALFMLGEKPLSIVRANVRDTEEILEDATKINQMEFPKEVKAMIDVFDSMESDLDETLRQNEILNIKKVKRESIDVQKNLLKRIKILEYDFQRCQTQSIDYELQLQHQKEKTNSETSLKNLCENFWISKMEKLENKNVSLEFQVQSLIKERENVIMRYQKLYDSIKKTQTQSQREKNELIESVNQKTYAYGDVRV
ncbi:hypothetical protein Tco_0421500 [Tanacetum coccineum]